MLLLEKGFLESNKTGYTHQGGCVPGRDSVMRIYVCIKHVPDTAAHLRLFKGPDFDRKVKFIMNPYDECALEQALQIRNQRGASEVIAVTVAQETAMGTIHFALAMGADRAILVKTDGYFKDSIETSILIHHAIESDGPPDLILTGKQSIDTEGMQIPFRLAALFDLPVVVDAVSFKMSGLNVALERDVGSGVHELAEMSIPCIVGVTRGINRPRCPTLSDMMKAKKKEVKTISPQDVSIPKCAPALELLDLVAVPDRGRGRMLKGSPENMTIELLRILKEEAKTLS